jgi:chromosome segregation ATPase
MKDKALILLLIVAAAVLAVALIVVNKKSADQQKQAADSLTVASNTVISKTRQLAELQTVNQTLETNLAAARADFSNKLALADANLRAAESNLEKATGEAQAQAKAQADSNAVLLAQRDQTISELEARNQALDNEAAVLRAAITNLDTRIAATQEKLAKSEGDRAFLLKELKQMQSEKAEMEKKFNNINSLRDQLRKLREQAAISQRLDWMRRGVSDTFNMKGGELLIRHAPPPSPSAPGGAKIELRESGGVKIQTAPLTNAPAK